jgi:hypothetical protein
MFSNDKKFKDKHSCVCKDCVKLYNTNYYILHKEKIILHVNEYYISNKEKVLEYSKEYYLTYKEKILETEIMKVNTLGIYFNESSIESDKEPSTELTIEKYDLDRSSGFIIARFNYEVETRSKLVFSVTVDGIKVDDYGTNLPPLEGSGDYDTTLFKYPNSAKANKLGKHIIKVKAGLIDGLVEVSSETKWKPAKAISEASFVITLVRNKE